MGSYEYKPIIFDYDKTKRNADNDIIQVGIFNSVVSNLRNIEDLNDDCKKQIQLFGFGPLATMKGRFKCPRSSIGTLHALVQKLFVEGKMVGSLAINRIELEYQHFVLDFDIKHINTIETNLVPISKTEYENYIQKLRKKSLERYTMNGHKTDSDLNSSFFVYEILYFLTEIIKLDWFPIYIMGKGGSFRNGFHIEIPDLIMSYHDISLLSHACHTFISNNAILDAPMKYSLFGSQKYNNTNESSILEMDCCYLPYAKYHRNEFFIANDEFNTLELVFDTFNIIKPITPSTKIYSFKISRGISKVDEICNALLEEKEMSLSLKDDNNHYSFSTRYNIGFLTYKTTLKGVDTISISKDLKDTTFVYHKDVNSSCFDYKRLIMPRNSSGNRNNDINSFETGKLRAFLRKYRFKIKITKIPKYYNNNNNNNDDDDDDCNNGIGTITNKYLIPETVEMINVNEKDDENDDEFFLHPFSNNHLFRLCKVSDRMANTVYYLISIILLSEMIIVYNTSFLRKWLCGLAKNCEQLKRFLIIYRILQSNDTLTLNANHQKWSILTLKHLLIINNVMSFSEACDILSNNEEVEKEIQIKRLAVTIDGAMKSVKIPDIILAFIYNYNDNNFEEEQETNEKKIVSTSLLYELLSLYRPILSEGGGGKGNQPILWDETNCQWKCIVSGNNSSISSNSNNVSINAPELCYIAKVINENQLSSSSSPPLAKKKKSNTISVNTIVNNIQTYWRGVRLLSHPFMLWKFRDCCFIIGGYDEEIGLLDIAYLPQYSNCEQQRQGDDYDNNINDDNDDDDNYLSSLEINELVKHINHCSFVQKQLYPLMKHDLRESYERTLQLDYEKRLLIGTELRKIINARNQFTDNFDKIDTQIEMEIISGSCGTHDARSQIKCDMSQVLSEKRRLAQLSRDQYHTETVEKEWSQNKREIVKLVKYFVLYQMTESVKDTRDIWLQSHSVELKRVIDSNEKKEVLMKKLAEVIFDILKSHPQTAHISDDLEPQEMTEITCNCPVAYTFLSLLQTFSYDTSAIKYVLRLFMASICYGHKLKNKYVNFFLGNTNSGKTQFLNLILSVIGHMAGIISPHTAYHGSSQDRIHDLGKMSETARFWYMDEIGFKPFNRQLLNQLSGKSPLFIRTNYTDGQLKTNLAPSIFIFGNNAPVFNENCPALMERLQFFTFKSQFNSKTPVCFKYSRFPQLCYYTKMQKYLKKGMTAIFLHTLISNNSPLYLYNDLNNPTTLLPSNVSDSTVMCSPIITVVRQILQKCGIIEEPTGVITVKRVIHLISNLTGLLKYIRVSSPTDALKFLDYLYCVSKIDNNVISCPDSHKELGKRYTTVYQGLLEKNIWENEEKISASINY